MNTDRFNVWLIEDNDLYRTSIAQVISELPGVARVECFDSCEAALETPARGAPPEILLLDVGLPGQDGIEAIPALKARVPQVNVIILTVFEDDEKIFRAVSAGATGYLLKTSSTEQIAESIAEVRRGGSPMTPRVARRVLEMFSHLAPSHHNYGLSPRERELLELLVQGLTNKEIARRLNLSAHTVNGYLRSVYEKLHVNTRSGAVAKALKAGLL